MPRSLWTGASGMIGQQSSVDVIANNIANVNTTGFKRQRVNFQDVFYDVQAMPGIQAGSLGRNPTGVQIGNGVVVSSTPRIFTQGNVEPTGKGTDVAIEGEGFFQATLPDGSVAYTRAGEFAPDANGDIVTPDGYFLEPRINIPDGATQVGVSTTGQVTGLVNGAETTFGQITLANFRNPAGLVSTGRNLFVESVGSGAATVGNPGDTGYGTVRNGVLEKANVEAVTELVNLIVAQRAFDMNSKSVKTSDEMLRTANELVR